MTDDPMLSRQLLAAVDRWMAAARDHDLSAVLSSYASGEEISGLGTGADEIGSVRKRSARCSVGRWMAWRT
jgi:hypothetical protein